MGEARARRLAGRPARGWKKSGAPTGMIVSGTVTTSHREKGERVYRAESRKNQTTLVRVHPKPKRAKRERMRARRLAKRSR